MSRKPNILILFADDMRFDTIRDLGNDHIHTPNIDNLIREGTCFTHAHIPGGTSGAVCMPSRAMLHTGKNLLHLEDRGRSIPESHMLMGEYLGSKGYDTYGIGKWHNEPEAFNRSFKNGNEILFGGMGDHWNVPANTYDPTGRYDRKRKVVFNPYYSNKVSEQIVDHITPGKHSTDLFVDDALKYLDRDRGGDPFFLYVSFMAPHDPRTMPDKYREMYDPDQIPLPKNFMPEHPFDMDVKRERDENLAPYPRTEEDTRQQIAEYYAIITHLDDRVGDIVAKLKETGEYDNTIILFAGDNGLAVGQHGLFGKQNLYDHSVRVPLILTGPGIEKNRKSDAYVYLVDIFPTLCEHLGLEIPDSVESMSFKKVIDGLSDTHREHLYILFLHTQRAVRKDEWKLYRCHVDGEITYRLFDLKNDPYEMTDLFGSEPHRESGKELMELMLQSAEVSGEMDTPWGSHWDE